MAIAVFSFLVWGHHMFTSSGQSSLRSRCVFSAMTFSVSIPSAIKVFNWLATMYKGRFDQLRRRRCSTRSLHLPLHDRRSDRSLPGDAATVDVHLHDTYFVVAHFHYVMFGGTVMAFLGGLFFWWPKMFGRMYSEKLGHISFSLINVGFNVTFFSQFIMGSRGMPRRYYDYVERFEIFHQISTIGSYIMALGFFVAAYALLHSLAKGRKAPANPWGGGSLEWATPSPPPHDNFKALPVARFPYNYTDLEYDEKLQGWVRTGSQTSASA